jgi:hypothetical protein
MERRVPLEKDPVTVGTAWARTLCENILGEGRVIAGGWPGTLFEARALIAPRLHDALQKRGMKALEPEELEQAVNATYARAKQEWLAAERRAGRSPRATRDAD